MLVFSGDLEEVEEIGCGGVDANRILIAGGSWVGELCYLKLLGALRREGVSRWGGTLEVEEGLP